LVKRDTCKPILNVVFGQEGIHAQFHARLDRLVERATAAKGLDGLLDQSYIRFETDFGDETMLFLAQKVAGSADFEVAHGERGNRCQGR
jgi:hypothetical protein